MIRFSIRRSNLENTKVALAVFFRVLLCVGRLAQKQEKPDESASSGTTKTRSGTSDAGEPGYITPQLIEARPMQRPGEVLEYVPGVIITRTAATARRTSTSCRGFNLDHGTASSPR